ncbi:response regulator transcription factor [Paenibacillus mesophilus]|uniref:response regulator transcription factor n=1 Tax=Paenibacillus mesophilus TaxID=2582849 RepID=UPI00110E6CEB|nr:response regulator transcription factor [Paenibacillus mesophilus]TMV48127.1 response regulator transcription factor [Paenibacillus mesophilus]
MNEIRVLIVEDDPDWLRGLSSYLASEPGIAVVASAGTTEEAAKAIRELDYDIVLMDIMLADEVAGISLAQEVLMRGGAKVLMLTSMELKELMFDAFRAGAADYLIKSDFERIPAAIRDAYRNESPISAAAAAQMREEFRRLKQLEQSYKKKELQEKITPSELQVLEMIDKGMSQPAIADKLVVSIRTIKVHVGNILKKLGGGSSKEAAQKARELGLFDEEERNR